jgi:hypothetical protein
MSNNTREVHPLHRRTADRTHFGQRLREIREQGQRRRTRVHDEHTQTTRRRIQEILSAVDHVERIEKLVSRLTEDLARGLSVQVELSRRFSDGGFLLDLRVPEKAASEHARRSSPSHLTVRVAPCSAEGRVTLECRSIVHDRDGEPATVVEDMSREGLRHLHVFLQRQFLCFARCYCDGRAPGAAGSELSRAEVALAA